MYQKLVCIGIFLVLPFLFPAGAGAGLFGPSDDEEIGPTQYAALLGLRDMDPDMFRQKLMPLIDRAMRDGKITVGELREMEKAAGNVADSFYRAATAPRLGETLDQSLEEAEKSGKELGSRLGDAFTRDLPQFFDEAMKKFQEQMRQYRQKNPESPQPPTSL